MKRTKPVMFGLAAVLLASCANQQKENKENPEAIIGVEEDFNWLLGEWERNNEVEGKSTFEYWEKRDEGEYYGISYTMQNEDTIWYEEMRLVEEGDTWNFEVTGDGDSISTIFRLTDIGGKSFTSVNEQNEFPKKIRYSAEGKGLHAVISGDGREIPFEFVISENH